MLCTSENHEEAFIHVIKSISDENTVFGMLGMRLLSNAHEIQLSSAIKSVEKYELNDYKLHQVGLSSLLNMKQIDDASILNMLKDSKRLIQQYGAMLIKRKNENNIKLINEALISNNAVVREFASALKDS